MLNEEFERRFTEVSVFDKKNTTHEEIQKQTEDFLNKGGKIKTEDANKKFLTEKDFRERVKARLFGVDPEFKAPDKGAEFWYIHYHAGCETPFEFRYKKVRRRFKSEAEAIEARNQHFRYVGII